MLSTRNIHCADGSGSRLPISPLKSLASYANALCAPLPLTGPSDEGEPSSLVCGNQNDQVRRNQGIPVRGACMRKQSRSAYRKIHFALHNKHALCGIPNVVTSRQPIDVTCLSCKRLIKRIFPSRISKRWRKSPASAKSKRAQHRLTTEAQHSVELLEFFKLLRSNVTKSEPTIFLKRIAFNLHYSIESIFSLLRG